MLFRLKDFVARCFSELLKRVEYPCIVYASTIKEIEGLKESLQRKDLQKSIPSIPRDIVVVDKPSSRNSLEENSISY